MTFKIRVIVSHTEGRTFAGYLVKDSPIKNREEANRLLNSLYPCVAKMSYMILATDESEIYIASSILDTSILTFTVVEI